MSPGPVEEASKVAQSVTTALASTPVVLALVVFNVIFMLMMGYISLTSSKRWDGEVERWAQIVRSCLPQQQ
jgi:hypothetical protein